MKPLLSSLLAAATFLSPHPIPLLQLQRLKHRRGGGTLWLVSGNRAAHGSQLAAVGRCATAAASEWRHGHPVSRCRGGASRYGVEALIAMVQHRRHWIRFIFYVCELRFDF